ncbi:hypothetical protein R6Q59_017751 [Mikania micrantha]
MAGLQQFYFFPTDFLDTIKDHRSIPVDANEDDGNKPRKTILVLQSVEKFNDDNYKRVKISSDSLPTRVVHLNKLNRSKNKADV